MPFNSSYSLAKVGIKNAFQLTDTSTGADPNLVTRTVRIYKADGTLLSSPIDWPIANNTITIAQISADMAANISVFWQSSNPEPSPSTYTYASIQAFTANLDDFFYSLTQYQTSNPNVINDPRYYSNKSKLRVEIDSAYQAIDYGEDVQGAQYCINRATYLMTYENFFF